MSGASLPKRVASPAPVEDLGPIHPSTVVAIIVDAQDGITPIKCLVVHRHVVRLYSKSFIDLLDLMANQVVYKPDNWNLDTMQKVECIANPKTFELFIQWLYFQEIGGKIDGKWELSRLVDLWLLGDQLITPKLQNYVMNLILKEPLTLPTISSECIQNIYNNTEVGSPLRRVVADQVRNGHLKLGADKADYEAIPRDMLVDILHTINNGSASDLTVSEDFEESSARNEHRDGNGA